MSGAAWGGAGGRRRGGRGGAGGPRRAVRPAGHGAGARQLDAGSEPCGPPAGQVGTSGGASFQVRCSPSRTPDHPRQGPHPLGKGEDPGAGACARGLWDPCPWSPPASWELQSASGPRFGGHHAPLCAVGGSEVSGKWPFCSTQGTLGRPKLWWWWGAGRSAPGTPDGAPRPKSTISPPRRRANCGQPGEPKEHPGMRTS